MNAKKQRDKNRRKASKLAEQAWEAAGDDNFDLAVKIIRRAVELHPASPVLWNDQGTLLRQLNDDDKAALSFQTAIQLAPDFAEAYANLAAVRARQGRADLAVALQREAVRHTPQLQRYQNALAAYEALLAGGYNADIHGDSTSKARSVEDQFEQSLPQRFATLADRLERHNWAEVNEQLTGHGVAHMQALLAAEPCQSLRAMFHLDRLFAKTVNMNKNHFGRGVYRYFAAPIPDLVNAIRHLIYPRVAKIANHWQRLLEQAELYPATWSELRNRCATAGQTTPSPLMLRYEAGGFNAPHQDIRGEVFFPVQLVIVLSTQAQGDQIGPDEFSGGEFLFCDQPERKPSDRRAIPAGLGDAVLFCTRGRLIRVGGVYGLQPVKHGLAQVTAGTRYAVGIPFHEFT